MPLTIPQAVNTLVPHLVPCDMLGVGVPKLARALGLGLSLWTPTISISTTDVGTAGAGKGVPVPILLVRPALHFDLLAGMREQNLLGMLAPSFIRGVSGGLVALYAQAFTNTGHVGVGVGVGVATFHPPPAFAPIRAGFAAEDMNGDVSIRLVRALSAGLERRFKGLVLSQPIVGPSSSLPGAGQGRGRIL